MGDPALRPASGVADRPRAHASLRCWVTVFLGIMQALLSFWSHPGLAFSMASEVKPLFHVGQLSSVLLPSDEWCLYFFADFFCNTSKFFTHGLQNFDSICQISPKSFQIFKLDFPLPITSWGGFPVPGPFLLLQTLGQTPAGITPRAGRGGLVPSRQTRPPSFTPSIPLTRRCWPSTSRSCGTGRALPLAEFEAAFCPSPPAPPATIVHDVGAHGSCAHAWILRGPGGWAGWLGLATCASGGGVWFKVAEQSCKRRHQH